jgi:hypothetical protein
LTKIAENWQKLPKIGKNWKKSPKIMTKCVAKNVRNLRMPSGE